MSPPLKDTLENAQHTRPCPACSRTPGLADSMRNQMGPAPNGRHPRGRFKGFYRTAMPVCDFCKGLKVVFLNRTCECGWPAVKWDDKDRVWSCGLTACTKSALWRREHPHTTMHSHMGPMGPTSALDFYGKTNNGGYEGCG